MEMSFSCPSTRGIRSLSPSEDAAVGAYADRLVEVVESQILPKIISEVSLPEHRLDILAQERKEGRRRKGRRVDVSFFRDKEQERIQLRSIKRWIQYPENGTWYGAFSKLQPDSSSSFMAVFSQPQRDLATPDGSLRPVSPATSGHSMRSVPSAQGELAESNLAIGPGMNGLELRVLPRLVEGVVEFRADSAIRKLYFSDSLFKELIDGVRDALDLRLADLTKLGPLSEQLSFVVTLDKDVEDSTWEKIHLEADLMDVSFDTRVQFWNWLDRVVRMTVDELKKKCLGNRSRRRRIEEVDRMIYVQVSM